jgi:hypothetical protein
VKSARAPRFVKNAGENPALDEKALARARKLAGLKGYVTNLPVSVMSPAEVISRYHDLWHVEIGHRWCPSSCFASSWSCSLDVGDSLVGRVPSGSDVVAGRSCPALA